MQQGEPPQLVARLRCALDLGARQLQKCAEGVGDGRHQDLVFALEVEINRAVGHAGALGDIRNPRVEKAMLSNDFHGGLKNTLVLIASFLADRTGRDRVLGLFFCGLVFKMLVGHGSRMRNCTL